MQPNPNSEGLSRFLSSSFINPLHHQEQQQPLFYSTREGYELGFNQHEDILPPEDDQRLLETNPRGIDHPTPAEEDGDGDGEDPFYNPTENNQNNHNNQHQNHLLNLMEISYANYQQHYSQSHYQPSPQSILNPNPNLYSGPSEGWKITLLSMCLIIAGLCSGRSPAPAQFPEATTCAHFNSTSASKHGVFVAARDEGVMRGARLRRAPSASVLGRVLRLRHCCSVEESPCEHPRPADHS